MGARRQAQSRVAPPRLPNQQQYPSPASLSVMLLLQSTGHHTHTQVHPHIYSMYTQPSCPPFTPPSWVATAHSQQRGLLGLHPVHAAGVLLALLPSCNSAAAPMMDLALVTPAGATSLSSACSGAPAAAGAAAAAGRLGDDGAALLAEHCSSSSRVSGAAPAAGCGGGVAAGRTVGSAAAVGSGDGPRRDTPTVPPPPLGLRGVCQGLVVNEDMLL